jgi:hypothetical protein
VTNGGIGLNLEAGTRALYTLGVDQGYRRGTARGILAEKRARTGPLVAT